MGLLPIPQPVDDALGALARRRGLPKEVATLVFSVGRHVIRAFGEGGPNHDEIAKIHARLDRCLGLLAADPSADPDGSLHGELRRLIVAVDAAASGAPAPVVPVVFGAPVAAPLAVAVPPGPVLAPVHAPIRVEPPQFIARAPAAVPPAPPPEPARSAPRAAPRAAPPVDIPPSVVHPFPAAAAAALERDWYWFVLEELSGLGGLLAYQRQQGETDAAARTERRVRATLDSLAWDLVAALRQAWSFAAERLRDADDVWGPHLVLSLLEPETERVRDWRDSLPGEMRAVIEATPLSTPSHPRPGPPGRGPG